MESCRYFTKACGEQWSLFGAGQAEELWWLNANNTRLEFFIATEL